MTAGKPIKNPPHPGRLVKRACLDACGSSVTDAARALKVARPTLSNLIHGRAGLSPEMAIRLEKAFGSTADAWLRLRGAYDLAQARAREHEIDVERIAAV